MEEIRQNEILSASERAEIVKAINKDKGSLIPLPSLPLPLHSSLPSEERHACVGCAWSS